jgi:hypothetical protein
MTPVRLPGKVSQVERFPNEWAMDCGDEEYREKSGHPQTWPRSCPVGEVGLPARKIAQTGPELGPAA